MVFHHLMEINVWDNGICHVYNGMINNGSVVGMKPNTSCGCLKIWCSRNPQVKQVIFPADPFFQTHPIAII